MTTHFLTCPAHTTTDRVAMDAVPHVAVGDKLIVDRPEIGHSDVFKVKSCGPMQTFRTVVKL